MVIPSDTDPHQLDRGTNKLPDDESNDVKTILNGAIEQIKSEIKSNRKIIPLSASSNLTFRCQTKVHTYNPNGTYASDEPLKDNSLRSSVNKKRGALISDLPSDKQKQGNYEIILYPTQNAACRNVGIDFSLVKETPTIGHESKTQETVLEPPVPLYHTN